VSFSLLQRTLSHSRTAFVTQPSLEEPYTATSFGTASISASVGAGERPPALADGSALGGALATADALTTGRLALGSAEASALASAFLRLPFFVVSSSSSSSLVGALCE
jgi:hypothetical protein